MSKGVITFTNEPTWWRVNFFRFGKSIFSISGTKPILLTHNSTRFANEMGLRVCYIIGFFSKLKRSFYTKNRIKKPFIEKKELSVEESRAKIHARDPQIGLKDPETTSSLSHVTISA